MRQQGNSPSPFLTALRTTEAWQARVWFAGIQFTFEGPRTLLLHLSQSPLAVAIAEARVVNATAPQPARPDLHHLPSFARMTCRVSSAHGEDWVGSNCSLGPRGVVWQWEQDTGFAVTQQARAHWRLGPPGWEGKAILSPDPRAADGLLTALASALLHRAGGAILHAASVALPIGVVAFVGPSGAGKSTACQHVSEARPFSVDRLAVVPSASDGWMAYPMPGGTPSESDSLGGAASGVPLCAVLRIRHASRGCWIENCSASRAVALLRQSAFHAGQDPGAELELLAILERLAGRFPVATLHLSLGTSLGPVLRRWLYDRDARVSESLGA